MAAIFDYGKGKKRLCAWAHKEGEVEMEATMRQ